MEIRSKYEIQIFKFSKLIFVLFNVILVGVAWAIELPLPSGSRVIQEETAEVDSKGNKVGVYESGLSEERVMSFYKKELARRNYNLFLEQENTAIFLKGNQMCLITVSSTGGKTQFIVSTAYTDSLKPGQAVCEDIASVPVYPGAKCLRSMKMRAGKVHSVNYSTPASIEEVLDFYQMKMPLSLWSLEQQINVGESLPEEAFSGGSLGIAESLSNAKQLIFGNHKGERCTIMVMDSPFGRQTLINIIYEEE